MAFLSHRSLHPVTAALCAGLLAVVCGCGPKQPSTGDSAKPPLASSGTPAEPEAPIVDTKATDEIGLVVLDPVVKGGDKATADLGIGCARWITLQVSGLPDFGRTPLWRSFDRVRREMKKPNLALNDEDALRFAKLIGATHAVTGTITSGPKTTLQYHIVSIADKKPVGDPIVVTGSPDEVVAGLPAAARTICARFGVTNPAIPATTELNASELTRLGTAMWNVTPINAFAVTQQLADLRSKSPLAGLICISHNEAQELLVNEEISRQILKQAPDNSVVFEECARAAPRLIAEMKERVLDRSRSYVHNIRLGMAEVVVHVANGDTPNRRLAAQRVAAAGPASPDAIMLLAAAIGEEASERRQAKMADQISEEDWTYLRARYAEWERLLQKPVKIDPTYGRAWFRLATAATFNGDFETADQAIWKPLACDKGVPDAYGWALEMYHRKWIGDEKKRVKVANLAASDPYPYPGDAVQMSYTLASDGYTAQAKALLEKTIPILRSSANSSPGDPLVAWYLARAVASLSAGKSGFTEYQQVIRLRPQNATIISEYAALLSRADRVDEALAQYRVAERLSPQNQQYQYGIAYLLYRKKQYAEAEKLLRNVLGASPNYLAAYTTLADLLTECKRSGEAVPVLEQGLKMIPTSAQMYAQLGNAYVEMGQPAKAIEPAERALVHEPNHQFALMVLAEANQKMGNFNACTAYARKAVEVEPRQPMAHLRLGYGLAGLGRKAEARAELNRVIHGIDPRLFKEAREQMDKLK